MANSKDLVLKKSHDKLNEFLNEKTEALPRDFNETRFLQNCMTVLNDTKNIEKMQPISIARTLLKGAFLGLDFLNRECYAIPYGNKLQFQTDYKGEIKLCKRYSINLIKDIYAKLVREGDEHQFWVEDGEQHLEFKPESFNNGEIIGAFAVCYYKDESMLYDDMSVEEIEGVRKNYSKMPNSMMWKNSFGEACKKTILRRLTKLIETDFDSQEQAKAFEDGGDAEFDNKKDDKPKEKSPFDETVDIDYEEVEGEEKEKEKDLSDEEFADKISEEMDKEDD